MRPCQARKTVKFMDMMIYKITNTVNGKVYIGQTIRPLRQRFLRHINDAHNNPNTHLKLHRAMNKYGADKFTIKKIDEATTKQELDEKEVFWIKEYDSVSSGYNLTAGGEGGNTYKCRTFSQMKETRDKLSKSKMGRANGMSKQIKAKNVTTGQEYVFDSLHACLEFLGIKNKSTVSDRASGKCNTLWRNEWMFAYEGCDYSEFHEFHYDPSCRKGTKVILKKDGESRLFNSFNKACGFLGIKKTSLQPNMVINGYSIEIP